MDKRFSEQQFRKSDTITFVMYKFYSHSTSGTGSYSRLADRRNAGKFQIFKFIIDQIFILFAAFNKVTALLEQ